MYNKDSKKNQKILIVEDSLTQAQKLIYCLEEYGYECILAHTGKAGLELMNKHSPLLVISDVMMPEMNGYEFCKAAKSDEKLKDTPIILLTSLSDTSDILRGLECGADNFITKPYEEDYLLARIDYILTNRELRKRDRLQIGVEIEFAGSRHFITSERQQILDLLISTYEQAVQINGKLKTREKELEETNLYLSTLNNIGSIVNQSLNSDKILNEVLDKLVEILDIDIIGVFLIEHNELQLKAHKSLPKEFTQKQQIETILKLSQTIQEPLELKAVPIEVLAKEDSVEIKKALDINFFVCVPLKVKNRLIGAILFCLDEQREFKQADVELVQNISNQIAIAIENTRLYELTRSQRIEEQAVLLSFSQYLLATFDIDEIISKTVETARELLKADFCGIFLPDAENKFIILQNFIGSNTPAFNNLTLPINQETAIGYSFLNKKPLCISDVLEQNRFYIPKEFTEANLFSTINVPIVSSNSVLGVLSVKTKEKRFFTIEDIHLLSLVTSKVAIAIQNAQAKKALRESEEKYRLLFEISPQAMWVYNTDTLKILAVNRAATTHYGYSEEEFLSMKITDIKGLEDNFETIESISHMSFKVWKHRKKDGSIIWVEIVSHPVDFSNQKAELIIATDVTERKQMLKVLEDERELLARRVKERTADLSAVNSELIKANRLKDEFLASMSHELRTPLNAILGMSEILKEGIYGSLNDKQLKSIKTVEESGQHLLSLINDILDVSKINAGKFELDLSDIEVEALAEACIRLVKQLAHQKNISVTSKISNNVQNLKADSRRLKQAIVNLLSNAIKFTPKDGSIGLEILGDEENQIINFVVWDTGIGIAPEHLEKLFVPFTQLDSSLARENVGTGLGLSLVKGIAELHSGGVKLESELGKGSRFTISLPWHQLNKPVKSQTKQIERSKPTLIEKTLIIEDSVSTANQLARYLIDLGTSTVEISDGSNVLEKILEMQPNLIILDILLSDSLAMTGWDILKELKANEKTEKFPILVVSVLDEEPKSKSLGASAHLLKPVTRESLLFALCKIGYQNTKAEQSLEIKPIKRNIKILIAEDNQFNLDIIYDYLLSNNYQLLVARNGKQALELAVEEKPDLILMDIQMPGMDGLEATRLIRVRDELKDIPIIALTALAMQGDKERCLQAGMNDYISKPINFKKLLEMIKHFYPE